VNSVAFHLQVPGKMDYTCRLLRKAVARGSRLMVTADAATLAQLDQDLWAFSATDFVPHCADTAPASVRSRSPVLLSEACQAVPDPAMILINLGHHVPAVFAGFARVIEVVSEDDQDKQLARQRWRYYASVGIKPAKYELGNTLA
jgi:DNA polymerase-3 subunit chi